MMDNHTATEIAYKNGYAAAMREQTNCCKKGNSWISVEERLPKSRADVLVVAYWGEEWQTMTGWYSAMMGKWRIITPFGEREPGGVTHWMPLPEPPKEADQ
jgi:hypothetical protein